ncbi:MAG: outer membrane beta-barrel protein [Bacteroidetes bacterium]|nr:outer membrane beta-barrel protein [Bacteroidota bacterium]
MRILIIFVVILATLSTKAQKFGGAAFVGISGSQVSGDNFSGFNKAGINGGISVNYLISTKNTLNMDLSFVQKGSKSNPNPQKGQYNSYNLSLNYIEVPIYLRFNANQKLFFDFGLSYGRLISSSEKNQYGEIPGTKPFNNADYSVLAGLGLLLKKSFSVGFKISNSFLAMRPHASNATYLWNTGQYNTVLTLNLIYQFKINANKQKI